MRGQQCKNQVLGRNWFLEPEVRRQVITRATRNSENWTVVCVIARWAHWEHTVLTVLY